MTDSDADTTPGYENGVIAAGYVADKTTAKAMIDALAGSDLKDVDDSTMFVIFKSGGATGYELKLDGNVVSTKTSSIAAGVHVIYFKIAEGANAEDSVDAKWDSSKTYKVEISLAGEKSQNFKADVTGQTVTLYQDVVTQAKSTSEYTFKKADNKDQKLTAVVFVSSDLIIDLNDHVLDVKTKDNAKVFLVKDKATLSIIGDDKAKSKMVLKSFASSNMSAICVATDSHVAIRGITYETDGSALFPFCDAASVIVDGSNVTSTNEGYVVGTNNSYSRENSINISILNGSVLKSDGTPVLINTKNTVLTIEGSTVTGARHAVAVVAGTANITDSKLVSDNGSFTNTGWSQGNDVTPGTLFVGNGFGSNAYAGIAKAVVTGGSITAKTGAAVSTTTYSEKAEGAVNLSISTKIVCGSGDNAVSVDVSDLKYTATSEKNPASPLLVKCGSVALSGTIDSLTVVDGDATVSNNLTIVSPGKLVVSSGATLTIANGKSLTIDSGATLTVEGSITGAINGTGKVIVQNGDVSRADFQGAVTVEDKSDDSARKTITWKDGEIDYYKDGSYVLGSNQFINIEGKVVLVSGSKLSIAGKLVVPAGAELVIESGAVLSFVNSGSLVVEGALTVEGADEDEGTAAGELVIDTQSKAEISGSLTVNGTVKINNKSEMVFKQDSSVLVAAGGALAVLNGKAIVDASAVLTVNGLVKGAVQNNGTVAIDSSVKATDALTISNVAVGAVVDVVKFTGTATLTVNDNGLVYTTYRDSVAKKDVQVTDSNATTVTITLSIAGDGSDKYVASVSGLKIVSVTSSAKKTDSDTGGAAAGIDKNGNKWSKSMDIAGSVSAAYALDVNKEAAEGDKPVAKAAVATAANSKGFAVTGELALGDNVTLTNSAEVSVTGILGAVKSATITNNGKITVSGEGEISDIEGTVANTVSTLYVTSVKDSAGTETKTNHYVNIDKALVVVNSVDSAVKTLTLQDEQTVKVSASLPADVTLDLNKKVLTIDSKDNVTLEIVKGATVKGAGDSKIAVEGTLYAQDKTNVKVTDIESDIYSEEIGDDGKAVRNGWAKWTNLSSALDDAKSGEKITLNKEVTLENNTTVPEGVTLDAGDFNIKLADGVTLTVNGILTTDADILAQSAFATEAKKVSVAGSEAYSSAVVVNGKLISSNAIAYVCGEAAEESGDEDFTDAVKLTEKGVVAGAYYENKDGSHVISSLQIAQNEFADIVGNFITVNGAVTAGDLSFTATEDCFKIVIGNDSHTILTVSSLTLSGMTLTVQGQVTGTVAVGDAAIDMKKASGIVIESDDSELVFTGTAIAGTVTVSKGTVYAGDSTINNTDKTVFTVASGATLEIAGTVSVKNLAINGIVNVPSAKTLEVSVNADLAGAVTVAPATDSKAAGTFNVAGELYMGISSDDLTAGAAASFSGPIQIASGKKVLVAADASVDDAFKASVKSYKNTEFYVQGSLWFTAYANGESVTIEVSKIPVENVKLAGWAISEDDKEKYDYDEDITIGADKALYAVIDTQVYEIIIKADEGIDNVYLDGQLMTYGLIDDGMFYYAYTATVAAGDHKITYTLKNGYSGEATLYSDGKAVAGNTIKSTGDFSAPSVFTLSGIQKSGYVDPTPVTPSDDGKDGLTITDYLLIVLVVLIVIMAVIVAMRLMRS